MNAADAPGPPADPLDPRAPVPLADLEAANALAPGPRSALRPRRHAAHTILERFGGEADQAARARAAAAFAFTGVHVDPPLADASPDTTITLRRTIARTPTQPVALDRRIRIVITAVLAIVVLVVVAVLLRHVARDTSPPLSNLPATAVKTAPATTPATRTP